MNSDVSADKIIDFMDCKGTPRGDAILNRIKTLINPPKPYPINAKRVSVKTTGAVLTTFLYPGKK